MKRREFITLLGGGAAATLPRTLVAQAIRTRRIGVLMELAADEPQARSNMRPRYARVPANSRRAPAETITAE